MIDASADLLTQACQRAYQNWMQAQKMSIDPNEANTRRMLVEPILRSLQWPMEDFWHVQSEYQIEGDQIDYLLFRTKQVEKISFDDLAIGEQGILVEVKRCGIKLHRKHFFQLAKYATCLAARWGLLTNGLHWVLTDQHKISVKPQERIVWEGNINDPEFKSSWSLLGFQSDTLAELNSLAHALIDDEPNPIKPQSSDTGTTQNKNQEVPTHFILPCGKKKKDKVVSPDGHPLTSLLVERENGKFDLLAGSYIALDIAPGTQLRKKEAQRIHAARHLAAVQSVANNPHVLRTTIPIRGISASHAALIALGRIANGHVEGRVTGKRNDRDIQILTPSRTS